MNTNLSKAVSVLYALFFSTAIFAQTAPPKAEVRNVTDDYFGTKIVDPYRWMEDLKSDEMQKWMRGQADYSNAYLKKLPLRDEFFKRLTELGDAGVSVSGATSRGDRYFYKNCCPAKATPNFITATA